ncbi:MAG: 50S ribosomal protein L4 [Defluviicoccus sp.]|nr:50S ribosomal protein L4 [Defluviicoccus sp.]
MKIDVVTLDNEKAGSIDLAEPVFAAPVRGDILARMVNWQRAKRRAGTHSTKGISQVRGTTAKPYKQKGTGRARHGSRRSPQWRGGSVTFGPKPRSHAHKLPKKVRRMALRAALSSKCAEGRLIVLDAAEAEDHRTAALAARIDALGWRSALIIGGAELDANFVRAAANLPNIDVLPQQGANVYDILRRETLVLTREAVSHLEERLS